MLTSYNVVSFWHFCSSRVPQREKIPVPKCRLLSGIESIVADIESVLQHRPQEAPRTYNVPTDTLRRRVTTGAVSAHCKLGTATVLIEEEEDLLAEYLIKMADVGLSLSIICMAFLIVEKSNCKHLLARELLVMHD